jgi:hypothetical protein
MVGPRRFELPTSRLSVVRSSQLSYGPENKMERVMGIEPTLSAWEADVLPLNYTREDGGEQGIRTLDTVSSILP